MQYSVETAVWYVTKSARYVVRRPAPAARKV